MNLSPTEVAAVVVGGWEGHAFQNLNDHQNQIISRQLQIIVKNLFGVSRSTDI